MIFAVIDTNVIGSAALAKCSEASTPYLIFDGILNNSFTPIVDDFILDEYQEILSRTKFHFTKEKINFFINAFLKRPSMSLFQKQASLYPIRMTSFSLM